MRRSLGRLSKEQFIINLIFNDTILIKHAKVILKSSVSHPSSVAGQTLAGHLCFDVMMKMTLWESELPLWEIKEIKQENLTMFLCTSFSD